MELTPAEIAENERIRKLPVIKELHKMDEEIVKDLDGLKQGQKELNSKVEIGFEKGRKRMDSIESDVREIKEIMLENNRKRDKQHQETLDKISNNEIQRLEKKVDDSKEIVRTVNHRIWRILELILASVFSIGATAFLIKSGIA